MYDVTHITIKKNLRLEKYLMSLILTKAASIWSNYSRNSNIVKYYYNLKVVLFYYILRFYIFICIHLLQSSVSRDPLEIILIYWLMVLIKPFLLLSM